jgi:low affinity Fe/Cu permease
LGQPGGVYHGHQSANAEAYMREQFRKYANRCADAVGSPSAFLLAVAVIVVWGTTGPIYGYSDTWQLVINTGTSIITFLMVFLLQTTQARDTRAMQLKLDELLRAVKTARDGLVRLEDLSDEHLDALRDQFSAISKKAAQPIAEDTLVG